MSYMLQINILYLMPCFTWVYMNSLAPWEMWKWLRRQYSNPFYGSVSWCVWNYHHVNSAEPHWWSVNIGLVYGLVEADNKSLAGAKVDPDLCRHVVPINPMDLWWKLISNALTNWSLMTHTCVDQLSPNLAINTLSPVRCQTITGTNAG